MGVIKLLFGWKALSIGGDSSLVLETWPRVCVSFCSQFSSEELFFAMNGGECRDPELFKVLTVSDCGMLDPTQVTCITPSKARERPGRGGQEDSKSQRQRRNEAKQGSGHGMGITLRSSRQLCLPA